MRRFIVLEERGKPGEDSKCAGHTHELDGELGSLGSTEYTEQTLELQGDVGTMWLVVVKKRSTGGSQAAFGNIAISS